MALTFNTQMADTGSNRKKKTTAYPDVVETVNSLHADEDTRTPSLVQPEAPVVEPVIPEKTKTDNAAKKSSGGGGGGVSGPVIPDMSGVSDSAYAQALAAAQAARGGAPTYSGSFDDQIAQLYAQINGRGEFNFDLNGDAFWQQYKDQYGQQAKNAMRDTMGQAAALTGGYGSSYGQAVGQQAYDRRIEELMDIAPELYNMAYQRYSDEGDRLVQQLGLARQLAGDEYDRYNDEYSRWLTERNYADEREAAAYDRQQDKLAMLQSLIALGYTPTAQEIADAGLTGTQYAALAGAYMPQPIVVRGSTKGNGAASGGDKYVVTPEGTEQAAAKEAADQQAYALMQQYEKELQKELAAQGRSGQSNRLRG